MDSYKVKQNLYGNINAYLTPLLVIAIVVSMIFSLNEGRSVVTLIPMLVLIAFALYRYAMYIKRPLEIEVNGNQIKMKDLFGKITECTFADISDIEVNKRRELLFTINENKIRGLNTFNGFDKFIEDAKKKNPNIKYWGFTA